jgi:hypothetical protein
MNNVIKDSLNQKSNEVLEGILLFLSKKNEEVTFENLEAKFTKLEVKNDKGKTLGSLFSGITRTLIGGKRLTKSYPKFGSRRKVWKLNRDISAQELEDLEEAVKAILEERK